MITMKNDREYRAFNLIQRDSEGTEPTYEVEGYASTFERYKLFEYENEDGDIIEFNEQIDPKAFDEADMSDCVFRVDHEGPVYARVSAGTVKLDIDENGLHNITNLSKTATARALHESIVAGNYPQMSFAFTVAEQHYDRKTHTRFIDRVAKVFDISPVTWPANPTTSLSARSKDFFDGEIEKLKAERLEEERRRKAIERLEKFTKGASDND